MPGTLLHIKWTLGAVALMKIKPKNSNTIMYTSLLNARGSWRNLVGKGLNARRRRRIHAALEHVGTFEGMTVLDVGCGRDGRSFSNHVPPSWRITGVDLYPREEIVQDISYVQQDARNLSRWPDNHFDLVVCIGTLEHFGRQADFDVVCSEIERLSMQHIIIVPYRYAWLEPHFKVPLFPLMPRWLQMFIAPRTNWVVREGLKKDPDFLDHYFRWPSNKEYLQVFPGSFIRFTPTLEMIAIIKSI